MPSGGVSISLQKADLSVCDEAVTFLQSGFWGAFKARFGWEALAFKVFWKSGVNENPEAKPLLVLRRPLAPGFSLAYIPWGPELPSDKSVDKSVDLSACDAERWAVLKELAASLREKLPSDTVFIRFDPPWYSEEVATSPPAGGPPFIRSSADIQAPDTVLVDLTQSMESLAGQMKPKWRYNARLALKKGVTVRRAEVEEISVFYDLLKETARRDGMAIHGIEYYRTLFEESRFNKNSSLKVTLYLAEHEGDVLAGIVTLFRGREAVYLYGASSNKKRGLMAPYALQLKAMEDAKAFGCEEYDLFGIPPDEDPSHPMAGLYRFKTGFGGRIIHRPGSWDYPCRTMLYHLFRRAEKLRKNLRTARKSVAQRNKAEKLEANPNL